MNAMMTRDPARNNLAMMPVKHGNVIKPIEGIEGHRDNDNCGDEEQVSESPVQPERKRTSCGHLQAYQIDGCSRPRVDT